MDTQATFEEVVKATILRYARFRPSHGDIRLDPVFDEQNHRYSLMQVGWDRGRRVRGNLIYVTIGHGAGGYRSRLRLPLGNDRGGDLPASVSSAISTS